MEFSPYEPWLTVQARARRLLKDSVVLPPSVSRGRPFHGIPRLRLWEGPGTWREMEMTLTVFELFTDGHEREPVVREAVWHRSTDFRRFQEALGRSKVLATFQPTVVVRDAAVSLERLDALLREASALWVPVTWFGDVESVTSDAGEAGFKFFSRDQPPAVLGLTWSHQTPPEWQPVLAWVQRLRELLEGCLSGIAPDAAPG